MEKYGNVIFKTFYFTFNYMCMCEGMYMRVQVSAWRNQKRALGTLRLELQMGVNHLVCMPGMK